MKTFTRENLKLLVQKKITQKGGNGQVTIIGGSRLFHGAPILSLIVASRVVDMVFFASPEKTLAKVAARIKSKLASFIWVPWEEAEKYIAKSDAVLIGPGFMRAGHEGEKEGLKDETFTASRRTTTALLGKFPGKKWVIDGGSLQVMEPSDIPKGAVLTPNRKEFQMLFGNFRDEDFADKVQQVAKKYNFVIAGKNTDRLIVSDGRDSYLVAGSGVPLTGGGTGDVFSGLVAGFLARNPPILAAAAAGFLVQKASESLFEKTGKYFNSDDLAWEIGKVLRT